jgi:hypothetical protein
LCALRNEYVVDGSVNSRVPDGEGNGGIEPESLIADCVKERERFENRSEFNFRARIGGQSSADFGTEAGLDGWMGSEEMGGPSEGG